MFSGYQPKFPTGFFTSLTATPKYPQHLNVARILKASAKHLAQCLALRASTHYFPARLQSEPTREIRTNMILEGKQNPVSGERPAVPREDERSTPRTRGLISADSAVWAAPRTWVELFRSRPAARTPYRSPGPAALAQTASSRFAAGEPETSQYAPTPLRPRPRPARSRKWRVARQRAGRGVTGSDASSFHSPSGFGRVPGVLGPRGVSGGAVGWAGCRPPPPRRAAWVTGPGLAGYVFLSGP